jgi:hypothetical protein
LDRLAESQFRGFIPLIGMSGNLEEMKTANDPSDQQVNLIEFQHFVFLL